MPLADFERRWVDALNRGDVAVADETFTKDCVIHITGSPEPDLSVEGFKQMVAGLLAAFPDLHFTIEDQVVSGDRVCHTLDRGRNEYSVTRRRPADGPPGARRWIDSRPRRKWPGHRTVGTMGSTGHDAAARTSLTRRVSVAAPLHPRTGAMLRTPTRSNPFSRSPTRNRPPTREPPTRTSTTALGARPTLTHP